jgi:hypothetical protein
MFGHSKLIEARIEEGSRYLSLEMMELGITDHTLPVLHLELNLEFG